VKEVNTIPWQNEDVRSIALTIFIQRARACNIEGPGIPEPSFYLSQRGVRCSSLIGGSAIHDSMSEGMRTLLLVISVLRRHPIVHPLRTCGMTIPGQSSVQPQLTWAVYPDAKVVQITKFCTGGIDPLDKNDLMWLDLIVFGQSI
jgi:hypothetical protein